MEGKNNVAMSRRYNQPGRRKWREAETRNSVRCRRTVGAGGWRKVNPGGCRKPGHSQVTEPPTFQRAASTANKTYDPSVRAIVGKLIRSIVEYRFYSIPDSEGWRDIQVSAKGQHFSKQIYFIRFIQFIRPDFRRKDQGSSQRYFILFSRPGCTLFSSIKFIKTSTTKEVYLVKYPVRI